MNKKKMKALYENAKIVVMYVGFILLIAAVLVLNNCRFVIKL